MPSLFILSVRKPSQAHQSSFMQSETPFLLLFTLPIPQHLFDYQLGKSASLSLTFLPPLFFLLHHRLHPLFLTMWSLQSYRSHVSSSCLKPMIQVLMWWQYLQRAHLFRFKFKESLSEYRFSQGNDLRKMLHKCIWHK